MSGRRAISISYPITHIMLPCDIRSWRPGWRGGDFHRGRSASRIEPIHSGLTRDLTPKSANAGIGVWRIFGGNMARESFARLMLLTYRALEVLMTFLFPAWYGPSARYRPENHYMRGPGPKWRAKYLAESVSPPTRSITSSRPRRE